MHKSQLGGILIDCQTDDLESASEFWSKALGLEKDPPPQEHKDSPYMALKTRPNDVYVELQKVDHPSRVHIDIETDDIEAEVSRLEALGARRVSQVKSWVVMEAPTGQRFCVVPQVRANFEHEANAWE